MKDFLTKKGRISVRKMRVGFTVWWIVMAYIFVVCDKLGIVGGSPLSGAACAAVGYTYLLIETAYLRGRYDAISESVVEPILASSEVGI